MKFIRSFFNFILSDGGRFENFMEWLDDNGSHNDWFIIRILSAALFCVILIPIIIFWLLFINVEFFFSRLIFRQCIRVPSYISDTMFKNEIRPWLEQSLPYLRWNYIEADFNTPILFRDKIYKRQTIEIRFLTRNERLLFELAWRGNVTFE